MITRQTMLKLIEKAENPSVSIFVPTHKKGEEIRQDPIRFKNALKEAENLLREHEIDPSEIEQLLSEARKLLDDSKFWQYNEKGLAVFITTDFFSYYRVPLDLKEQVLVEDHFMITPLLPMISLDGTFCILALSQKNIRLLRATRETVEKVMLEEAPESLEEFLKFNVNEPHIQHHSGEGKSNAIFHGQGGGDDSEEKEVENYLKHVENEVTSVLRKYRDPLILAGVNEAVAVYKKVNHYDHLIEEEVSENPDPKSNEELGDLGWEVIKSYFLKTMYRDMERFADLTGSKKRSDNLSQIVEASFYGKIDSLFVPIGKRSWGWFDEERDTVHHSAEQQNGDHDLINMAAIKTLAQGGNVYALEKEEMPQEAPIAAIFRYS